MFATDWMLEEYESRDVLMREVRSAFNQLVVLMAKQQSQPEQTMKALEEHLSVYGTALNSVGSSESFHAAATAFLELCGDRSSAKDIRLVMSMSLEFSVLTKTVQSTLE
jgi:hypothetical protein